MKTNVAKLAIKKLLIALTVFLIAFFSLSAIAADLSNDVPKWVASSVSNNTQDKSYQKVYKTTYKNAEAYYFTSRCCDIPSKLFDKAGVLICYPNGGFVGVDSRCPGFMLDKNAKLILPNK